MDYMGFSSLSSCKQMLELSKQTNGLPPASLNETPPWLLVESFPRQPNINKSDIGEVGVGSMRS